MTLIEVLKCDDLYSYRSWIQPSSFSHMYIGGLVFLSEKII